LPTGSEFHRKVDTKLIEHLRWQWHKVSPGRAADVVRIEPSRFAVSVGQRTTCQYRVGHNMSLAGDGNSFACSIEEIERSNS
jgi:hypothetical protein